MYKLLIAEDEPLIRKGICAALDLVAQGALPQRGFVGQEAIDLDAFINNRFGRVYAGKPLALAGSGASGCAAISGAMASAISLTRATSTKIRGSPANWGWKNA